MIYTFHARGHQNLTGKHKNTLEFTKDPEIGIEADCIIGVKADFDLSKLKEFIQYCREHQREEIKVTIQADNETDTLFCHLNFHFNDQTEIVIRTTKFISKRTLGILATKSAKYLKGSLISKLKNPNQDMTISITDL